MKKVVCLLRDEVATTFGTPITFESIDFAVRSFGDLLSDGSTLPGKHPADFSLYKIAEYDDVSGDLYPCDRVVISRGSDFNFGNKDNN